MAYNDEVRFRSVDYMLSWCLSLAWSLWSFMSLLPVYATVWFLSLNCLDVSYSYLSYKYALAMTPLLYMHIFLGNYEGRLMFSLPQSSLPQLRSGFAKRDKKAPAWTSSSHILHNGWKLGRWDLCSQIENSHVLPPLMSNRYWKRLPMEKIVTREKDMGDKPLIHMKVLYLLLDDLSDHMLR